MYAFILYPYKSLMGPRTALLSLLLLFTQLIAYGQYTGGDDDGFHSAQAISQSFTLNMYTGGDNDGFHLAQASSQSFSLSMYTGGDDDGFNFSQSLSQSFTLNMYTGGNDDGFTTATAPGQAFTFNIYTGGGDDGFTFGATLVVLPVKLLSFTGAWSVNDAVVKWVTSTETNNHHFEIQRGFDGQNFTTIGNIPGAGNSTMERNYSFTDPNARSLSSNVIYYRLRQVDMDNKYSYSGVIMLK